jgi:Tol biopolymer transport system component
MWTQPKLAAFVVSFAFATSFASAQTTELVSLASSGAPSDGGAYYPSISSTGRWVAFHSSATNLFSGDDNDLLDVFVRDRTTGQTTLVSADPAGAVGNSSSYYPSISADGRWVAFVSDARTLVAGDTNGVRDIFVRDRTFSVTVRASVDSYGHQGNGGCYRPMLSADGRFVVFGSDAGNLVEGDGNGTSDIFLRDLAGGTTVRVSVDSSGGEANGLSAQPSISADGRYVAFCSWASNLVPGDTNGVADVFVHDCATGRTARVSLDAGGAQVMLDCSDPDLSADGRSVAFCSASPLVPGDTNGKIDVFVRDLRTGRVARVSTDSNGGQSDGDSTSPVLSLDGRFVAFRSIATNLVAGDANAFADVFVKDVLSGQTRRASVDSQNAEADGDSQTPALAADGRSVAFASAATNLVASDTNDQSDVFVHDLGLIVPVPFCAADGASIPCPCGNFGDAGNGCENSLGTGGGVLVAGGMARLSFDSLVLVSWGEPSAVACVFMQGSASGAAVRFGDGLRCLSGAQQRLYFEITYIGATSAPTGNEQAVSERSASLGAPIPIGATRYYQVAYRDPSSAFCPPPLGGTWNVTSGVAVVWAD